MNFRYTLGDGDLINFGRLEKQFSSLKIKSAIWAKGSKISKDLVRLSDKTNWVNSG